MTYALILFIVLGAVITAIVSSAPAKPEAVAKALEEARSVSIAEYPAGQACRIEGEVVLDEAVLAAPLSGRRCVAYEIVVEQARPVTSPGWDRVVHVQESVSFSITDYTGRAVVDATVARLAIVRDPRVRSRTFDDPNPREQAFLAPYRERLKPGTLRVRERAIEPGCRVAVRGYGAYLQRRDERILRIRTAGSESLYISDDVDEA